MCKTLIIEDNSTFRKGLKRILYARFPTMEIAEEGEGSELLSTIDVFHPNVVFMDVCLPGGNGLELTKMIKMNYPDIIVVILTSYDLPEYRQAATQSKADYFITKDSQTQNFTELVESICPAQKSCFNREDIDSPCPEIIELYRCHLSYYNGYSRAGSLIGSRIFY